MCVYLQCIIISSFLRTANVCVFYIYYVICNDFENASFRLKKYTLFVAVLHCSNMILYCYLLQPAALKYYYNNYIVLCAQRAFIILLLFKHIARAKQESL